MGKSKTSQTTTTINKTDKNSSKTKSEYGDGWYSYIYDESQLHDVAIFKNEHVLQKINYQEYQKAQHLRSGLLTMLLVNWVMLFSLYDLSYIVCFFTNWTLLVTTIWIALSVQCAKDPQVYAKRPGLLAVHHMAFEVAVICNLVIMVVYWPMLHKSVVDYLYERGEHMKIVHNHLVHIFPFTAVALNFLFTDVVISGAHTKALLPIAITYGYKNYQATIQMGEPVYWFLDWEDYTTVIIYGAITTGAMTVFYILAWITYSFKRSNLQRPKCRCFLASANDKIKCQC